MLMRKAAFTLALFLAGCAAQAAGTSARLDLPALVRAHPLYPALAQYDRQIAQLRVTLHPPAFAHVEQAFSHAERGVRVQLDAAQTHARSIAAMPEPSPVPIARADTSGAPSEATVRADIRRTYDSQRADSRNASAAADAEYRRTLLAQQESALAAYERGTQTRVHDAYQAREQEMREQEAELSLNLAKADAARRLELRSKLQTLVLDAAARERIRMQLRSIQAREDAILSAKRKRDASLLAAVLPPLRAQAAADVARMRAQLERRTAANLTRRAHVLQAQNAAHTALQLPSPAPSAGAEPTMQDQLQALRQSRPADPAAYARAGTVLERDLRGVQGQHDAAQRDAQSEIAALQDARARLYREIVRQIDADARRLAREHPGADVTALVRADLQALRH